MYRIYVERKQGFKNEAIRIKQELVEFLGISGIKEVRYLNRYDIENVPENIIKDSAQKIFSEAQSDIYYFKTFPREKDDIVIAWEYLPGQYDQRSDSALQCLSLLKASFDHKNNISTNAESKKENTESVRVKSAKIVVLQGNICEEQIKRIENYLINPVDSRHTSLEMPETLNIEIIQPKDIPVQEGFINYNQNELNDYRQKMGLAMDTADIEFLQKYFAAEGRDPTETEIRVLDTYWSDHCRHTTFNTVLDEIKIEEGEYKVLFEKALLDYNLTRTDVYEKNDESNSTYKVNKKPVSLMDMACIGAKYLKKHGKLNDIEISKEINACSIYIDVHKKNVETKKEETERWLLMFKNETHNHPTEIEPFGGAATCIGGAIRDPLSGRSWVYQALRVTGCADPTVPLTCARRGKLPQMKLTREAAAGFSSYGNQIGLTTGQVAEVYHQGFEAKRMELGAVIAAGPASVVMREDPENGDCIILVGGGTGRDGIGGATGSSKVHNEKSVETAGAEVQKGNAVEERKIQRLFRNPEVSKMIRRCNDFGAGGVAVAVGELAAGLEIDLDCVPKKYEGLNGTELAISESQERMAIVVRKTDVEKLIEAAEKENLHAALIAKVTDTNRLVMKWRGKTIVDIDRNFLDTAGAQRSTKVFIENPAAESPLCKPLACVSKEKDIKKKWLANISSLECCSQRGLAERFDGSIGCATVNFPFGGKYQGTPECGCTAKIPVLFPYETDTASIMTYGYDPGIASWSSYHGAQIAVLSSLSKIVALGGNAENCRLTFQEYFERTVSDKSWGKPVAALLGALQAQKAMGTASIGGKDSMSGSFEELTVPPTLVSFAVATESTKNIQSGSFKKIGSNVYCVRQKYDQKLTPDWEFFKQTVRSLYELNKNGKINAMYPVGAGGIAEAVTKMAFGNKIGFEFSNECFESENYNTSGCNGDCELPKNVEQNLFGSFYGSIIVETDEKLENFISDAELIGKTIKDSKIKVHGVSIDLEEINKEWERKLAKVFAPISDKNSVEAVLPDEKTMPEWAKKVHPSVKNATKISADFGKNRSKKCFCNLNKSGVKPKVILPVFPGTNCEFDMARAFSLAGAESEIFVFKNYSKNALEDSLKELEGKIKDAQIFALSGGFSCGDEPDGSGKFIANVLREHRIADSIMDLIKNRDGLVLGICNGFQALIKVGLVPYGEIRAVTEDMPTLTFNTIGRHISRVARTRLTSAKSPWALNSTVLADGYHMIPISHGEGRVIIGNHLAKELFDNGQVFSQYCDESGNPAIYEPDNPNGSQFAIEGLTSPDGHVLGKMGHSERTIGVETMEDIPDLIKNINGNKTENIFAAGVEYFC
ncbi:MAG: phosphoribosylformylglycinamidine synthase [Treponemataceae bacterium]